MDKHVKPTEAIIADVRWARTNQRDLSAAGNGPTGRCHQQNGSHDYVPVTNPSVSQGKYQDYNKRVALDNVSSLVN